MKPPPFVAERPQTLDAALGILAEQGDMAKPIAGGQSLYPLLALRFARPDTLVDLTAVGDGDLRSVSGDAGRVRVGALVPHIAFRREPLFAGDQWAALREASRHIGHYPIQVRGTVGGSLVHADPSAELCALILAYDAELEVVSRRGRRTVAASDWVAGPFQTALQGDELLTHVTFTAPAQARSFFAEVAPRPGDFATASAAIVLADDYARIVVSGAAGGPIRCEDAERLLSSTDAASALDAANAAIAGDAAIAARTGDAAAAAFAAVDDDPVKAHLVRGLVTKLAREALDG